MFDTWPEIVPLGAVVRKRSLAMFNLNAAASDVTVDGPSGRPREIRAGGERLLVTSVEAVRDETAAYPLESGPRTVFVVRARDRRYRLVHLLRDGRWTVQELAAQGAGMAQAA
jgi:hypothetical protein